MLLLAAGPEPGHHLLRSGHHTLLEQLRGEEGRLPRGEEVGREGGGDEGAKGEGVVGHRGTEEFSYVVPDLWYVNLEVFCRVHKLPKLQGSG